MSATYDPSLPTDRDHVRFLIGDTNVASPQLEDEEIDAVIDEETATGEALKYFAAASALAALHARWTAQGSGVVDRQVGALRIRRAADSTSANAAVMARISDLRARGAHLLTPRPRLFRVL